MIDVGDWTDVFVGVHRGFSPVSPGQPKEVSPELSWNYEGGFRWDLGSSQLEMVGFFNDYENILGQCSFSGGCNGDSIDQQYNGGEVWIYGIENLIGFFFPFIKIFRCLFLCPILGTSLHFKVILFEFSAICFVSQGDTLPYLPQHQGSLSLGLQTNSFDIGLNGTYRSQMLDLAGTF